MYGQIQRFKYYHLGFPLHIICIQQIVCKQISISISVSAIHILLSAKLSAAYYPPHQERCFNLFSSSRKALETTHIGASLDICASMVLGPVPMCGLFFPHCQAFVQRQLNVLQFNSILMLSTWRQHQIPQVKASFLQDCPYRFRLSPVLLPDLLQVGDPNDPLLQFD